MIVVKIDCKKIDKAHLYTGAKGTYLDLALIDKPDEYGNAGFVSQQVSKEKREAGERGPILGSWKHIGKTKDPNDAKPIPPPAQPQGDDDLPF